MAKGVEWGIGSTNTRIRTDWAWRHLETISLMASPAAGVGTENAQSL
jgi:hypothetical protein